MNSLQLGLVLVASIWAAMNTLIAGNNAMNGTRDRIFSCVERIMLSDSSGTIAACSHGNTIALFINRIEPSFGFKDWRAMQNPHVFEFIRADGTWSVNN